MTYELKGYATWHHAKCGSCGTKKDLTIYSVPDRIKGLPVEKIYMLCENCARKRGLPHYPPKEV